MSLTTHDARDLSVVLVACLALAVISGVAVYKTLNFCLDLIRIGELTV